MTLQQLTYFLAALEHGSFSAAADALHMAYSGQLSKAKEELGHQVSVLREERRESATLNLTLGGLVFLLGFIVFRENPGQRLNRVVALMLFFGGLGSVLAALSFLASGGRAGATSGAPDLLQNMSYLWEFFFPSLFLFASIFPEEREFARRRLAPWLPGFVPLVFAPMKSACGASAPRRTFGPSATAVTVRFNVPVELTP